MFLLKKNRNVSLKKNRNLWWKSKTRVTSCELGVQIYESRVQIHKLRVQIHDLGN